MPPSPIADRGLSPVVGYVLVVSIVLSSLFLVFIGGGAVIGTITEPRDTSSFEAEIKTTEAVGIQYASGDEFSAQNTEEIRVLDVENGTEEVVYTAQSPLEPGDFLVKPSDNVSGVSVNSTVRIVWHDTGGGDRIIDTVDIPAKTQLTPSTPEGGDDQNVTMDPGGVEEEEDDGGGDATDGDIGVTID
jgi:FlaG/FlaF family flagellin (archaellin)